MRGIKGLLQALTRLFRLLTGVFLVGGAVFGELCLIGGGGLCYVISRAFGYIGEKVR